MPKYTKDQLDQYSKDRYEHFNSTAEDNKKRYSNVVKRFGKNGTISAGKNEELYTKEAEEKYNSITLPDVPGMDDDMIALVSLGVAFDEKNLNKSYTSSSAGSMGFLEFNRTFMDENIILNNDGRTKDFSPILPVARQQAKDALDDYNNGNKEKVKAALKNIAEYLKGGIGGLEFNSNRTPGHKKGFFKTISKFMDDPDLGVKDMFNERELARLKANVKKEEAFSKATENAKNLILEHADANTPEREKQVTEYLMNMLISSVNSKSAVPEDMVETDLADSVKDIIEHDSNIALTDEDGASRSNSDVLQDLNQSINQSVNQNLVHDSPKYKKHFANSISGDTMGNLKSIYMDHNISHEETILSEDDGIEKFTALYKDKLKESPLYKSLVNAKTPKEMATALNNADLRIKAFGTDVIEHEKAFSEKTQKLCDGKTEDYNKKLATYRKDIRTVIPGAATLTDLDSINQGLNARPASLNIFQRNHNDSQSMIELREKTLALEMALHKHKIEPAYENKEVRKALLEAYKASIKYQTEKMQNANVDPTNSKWEPTSSMGKERFRAARKIEELAKEFIMDDIMEYEKQAAMEENQKIEENAYDKLKQVGSAKLEDNTVQGKALNNAVNELKAEREAHPFTDMSKQVAKVMAVKMVTDFYKSAKIKVTEKNAEGFNDDVEKTAADLQTRDDFKYMMSKRSIDAENAALTDGGKMLFPMLATAKRNMPKTPKNVQRTTTQPQIKNDLSLK